jgi:hypothetical protein
MILAFKPQFVEPILNGSKIHTIREDKSNRWVPGKQIHFATGVRTKQYNQFGLSMCNGVQRVSMSHIAYYGISILVDGKELDPIEKFQFIEADGFRYWIDFFAWFYPLIKATNNNCYEATIIHWTDFRY